MSDYYRVVMKQQSTDPFSDPDVDREWLCVPTFPMKEGAEDYIQRKQKDCAAHPDPDWNVEFSIIEPGQIHETGGILEIRPCEKIYPMDSRLELWLDIFVEDQFSQVGYCEDHDGIKYAVAMIPWPTDDADWIWRIICSYPDTMSLATFARCYH